MAKKTKNKRSRFDGISLDKLNEDIAKLTGHTSNSEVKKTNLEEKNKGIQKKGQGRPKNSTRKPLNTAIEPKNRQRLEFLAMLNGGSIADQLNDILEKYFTEIEKVDELIDLFEARKQKNKKQV